MSVSVSVSMAMAMAMAVSVSVHMYDIRSDLVARLPLRRRLMAFVRSGWVPVGLSLWVRRWL